MKDTTNVSSGNLKNNMSCVSQTIEHLISYLQLRGSFSKGCPPAAQNSRTGGKLQTELPAKDPPHPSLSFLCGGGQDARAGD